MCSDHVRARRGDKPDCDARQWWKQRPRRKRYTERAEIVRLVAGHVGQKLTGLINWGPGDRSKFDDHLRLALVMTSLVLVIFAGASFTTANRTQSRLTATLLGFTGGVCMLGKAAGAAAADLAPRALQVADDSELLDSSKILAAHCVAVSLSVMVLSFAGLVSKPLLRNPIAPYIIVSLDLATLPLRALTRRGWKGGSFDPFMMMSRWSLSMLQ